MTIPRQVKRYAAGTDTRNQFTTPPDQRQVEDLMVAMEAPVVGAQQKRTAGFSTQYTHNSGVYTWDIVDVSSGGMFWTDGYMSTSANCYGPLPSSYYTDYTYLCFDVNWCMDFPAAAVDYYMGVQVITRLYASPYTVISTTTCYTDMIERATNATENAFQGQGAASGTAAVRLATGQCIHIEVFQSKGATMAMDFQWGTRLVGATN